MQHQDLVLAQERGDERGAMAAGAVDTIDERRAVLLDVLGNELRHRARVVVLATASGGAIGHVRIAGDE